jgi:hypothetical protein
MISKDSELREYLLDFLKTFLLFLLFATIQLFLKPGSLFYEQGHYVDYLESFYDDGDLNVINQVPKREAWIVTKTFSYPSQYSYAQTVVLAPIYLVEWISGNIQEISKDKNFIFQLTTIAMNFMCLWVGFFFLNKACSLLSLKKIKVHMALFYFGSAFFYFSILQTTVIEIAAFPILSYCLFLLVKLKASNEIESVIPVGVWSGILFVTKHTFWFLPVLTIALISKKAFYEKKWLTLTKLFSSFAIPIFYNALNKKLQFGDWNQPVTPAAPFFDFSFESLSRNLIAFIFHKGGIFFVNPVYFLGILGAGFFIFKFFKHRKIQLWEAGYLTFFLVWIFLSHIVMIGYLVEDHLPGRFHLAAAPLLILGLSYLLNAVADKYQKMLTGVLVLACFWHLFLILNYVAIAYTQGGYFYAQNVIGDTESFRQGLDWYIHAVIVNLGSIYEHAPQIILFSVLISSLFVLVWRYWQVRIFGPVCACLTLLSMTFLTVLNILNAKENIQAHENYGLYKQSVVGDGAEIFFLDYAVDYVKTAESRNGSEVVQRVRKMLDDYYGTVRTQVIRSTPWFDEVLKNKDDNFSFFIQNSQDKKKIDAIQYPQ